MDVAIRDAVREDYQALCALWREMDDQHARLLPGFFRSSPRPPRTREELDRALDNRDEKIRVMVASLGIVALVHVQIYDAPPVAQITPRRRAHVDSLIVAAKARRQGLGRRLVQDASAWARSKGAAEILLTVWTGNDVAEKFYEALGFGRVSSVLAREL